MLTALKKLVGGKLDPQPGKQPCTEEFDRAAHLAMEMKNVSSDAKLQLYGLFKQSTVGDCQSERPLLLDMIGRAKWDAWDSRRGIEPREAQQKYIELVDSLRVESGSNRNGTDGATGFGVAAPQGFDVEQLDGDSLHQLLHLASVGDVDELKSLLETETDLTLTNECGETALHFAADRGHSAIVGLLLEQGGRVNAASQDGCTPLHYACLNGNIEVVRMLMSAGANPTLEDQEGSTPLDLCDGASRAELEPLLAV